MRANVVVLFAFLVLTFVAAQGDAKVSGTINLNYIAFHTAYGLQRQACITARVKEDIVTEEFNNK